MAEANPIKVLRLWRYAVKGLDPDELPLARLKYRGGLPFDRNWALHFTPDALPSASDNPEAPVSQFDPHKPQWVHKQCFLAAFTAGQLLGTLQTRFDDKTMTLTVSQREDGKQLLQSQLDTPQGRSEVSLFFTHLEGNKGRKVHLVQSAKGEHHFGNTPRGFKTPRRPDGHKSGYIIHIVNAATVRQLSAKLGCTAAGKPLAASRFRPNIVIDGLPAWEEFRWVGHKIRIGQVVLEVVSRTVRCDATRVDPRGGSGKPDFDIPNLLRQHYPEYGPYFGVYARVCMAGTVKPGDTVKLVNQKVDMALYWLRMLGFLIPILAVIWHFTVSPLVDLKR